MSETDPLRPSFTSPAESGPPEPSSDETGSELGAPRGKRRGGISGLYKQIQAAGRDLASVALGKLIEPPTPPVESQGPQAPPAETDDKSNWKVSMLHSAAERLRGAADTYIAAKLDEIEALVDSKLDHVEQRIDAKIVELHRQLREMRDRELRHRLRLLKITLIFTVLVAVLSLGYKWLAKYLVG